MPQPIIYLLLFVALVLPVPGALALRLLAPRLGERGVLFGAGALFSVAIVGVLVLARADVSELRVGNLTLLLSGTNRSEEIILPPEVVISEDPVVAGPPVLPTLTPRPSATPASTATPTAEPTSAASPTPEATATPTAEPPTATPEPAATGQRRYTVEAGDTARAIAERFDVTVAELLRANDLTPDEADSLRIGQELIIP